MSGRSDRDAEGYGLAAAVRDVFGGGAAWASWIVIAVGGGLGYLVLPMVAGSEDVGGSLKPWACAAYGIALGGVFGAYRLLSLLQASAPLRSQLRISCNGSSFRTFTRMLNRSPEMRPPASSSTSECCGSRR